MVIQQVIDLSTIYFIHRDSDSEVSLVLLEVVNTPREQIFNSQFL